MRSRAQLESLNPQDIEFLQDCFDTLQRSQLFPPMSEDADVVARALISAYQRGIRDKDDLLKLARLHGQPVSTEVTGSLTKLFHQAEKVEGKARRTRRQA